MKIDDGRIVSILMMNDVMNDDVIYIRFTAMSAMRRSLYFLLYFHTGYTCVVRGHKFTMGALQEKIGKIDTHRIREEKKKEKKRNTAYDPLSRR